MTISWQPSASCDTLRHRATLIQQIRKFFEQREVLEVFTPLLSQATVCDPHLHSFTTLCQVPGQDQTKPYYLQTSPEFAMKRLLAAGMGSIYQICPAFRHEESGRYHNPEFTLLEWYRVGFDHWQLMDEMDEFLQLILDCRQAERCSYQALFQQHFNINPHQLNLSDCHALLNTVGLAPHLASSVDDGLHLLMSHVIEPALDHASPVMVYDFPASQAALAQCRPTEYGYAVAERFEVYYQGLELANGFHELTDPEEQAMRFAADLAQREAEGKALVQSDQRLIEALTHGLPPCAGVALGIDRLLMLKLGLNQLSETLSFAFNRA